MTRCAAAVAALVCMGWLSLGVTGVAAAGPGEYCQLQPRPPSCDPESPTRSDAGLPGGATGNSPATYAPWSTATPKPPSLTIPQLPSRTGQQPSRATVPKLQIGS